jgi:PiT family inorganic phosphate transporter
MVAAWIITIPSAAVVGALMWYIADILGGGLAGAALITILLIAAAGAMYVRSRQTPVHADNVNEEWDDASLAPAGSEKVAV